MEENQLSQPEASVFDITISPSVAYSLKETCRWAALLVYITGSLLVLFLLGMAVGWSYIERVILPLYSQSALYGAIATGLAVVMFLVLAISGTLLTLLYLFTLKVKKGLRERDLQMVESGVASLKFYFAASGVLGGIFLVLGLINVISLF